MPLSIHFRSNNCRRSATHLGNMRDSSAGKSNTFSSSFFHGATAPSGPKPPHFRGFMITVRHTTVAKTSLDDWSASRSDLYPKTHNTHDRHPCPGGIRTRNSINRTGADLHLRQRGHRDQPLPTLLTYLLNHSMEQSPSWEANRFASWRRNSPHFMEPEGSSHSKAPATSPHPEPAR